VPLPNGALDVRFDAGDRPHVQEESLTGFSEHRFAPAQHAGEPGLHARRGCGNVAQVAGAAESIVQAARTADALDRTGDRIAIDPRARTTRRSEKLPLQLVGRKGRDFLGKRGLPVRFEYVNLPKVIRMAEAEAIAQPAVEDYIAGRVNRVVLVYNEFKSVIQQKLVLEQLLPLQGLDTGEDEDDEKPSAEYIYEPSPERILELLLRQLIVAQVLRALVESNAAFYAAQMTAMDSATRNSTEIIENLTLYMNKLRQAAITREIIEVVSGAQAL